MSDYIAIADDDDTISEPTEKARWQHEELAQVEKIKCSASPYLFKW